MTGFTGRAAKHFVLIKAARVLKKEIEKAGLDNLIALANADISIVETYLQGCPPQERATYRQDLNTLLQMGVTPDMVFSELIGQMPELAPIIESKQAYMKGEVKRLEQFLKEG